MLAVSHRSSSAVSPLPKPAMDVPGTINPAALNASSASTIAPGLLTQPSPRGVKRSRSPDTHSGSAQHGDGGDQHSSKRSRPLKHGESASSTSTTTINQTMPHAPPVQPIQTPHVRSNSLSQASPSQSSPQRSTPGSSAKPAVLKALPTVRDHTTDQLGPEGDEYLPRETDSDGELKVSKDGYPQGGRKYKCRTFRVPDRGEKLFMLATECARVLGYRDSYLLFNKNRSLYKIIANQAEKDNLIQQEILPYSYRSRQIAIVTARSMFRQFGSRLIESGRRVRDDYWEAKARKQGFTEEDAAGEKRPGAAKQREAAAAEASQTALTLPQGEIIYSNGPAFEGPPGLHPNSLAPLPMIHLGEDYRPKDFNNVASMRPRYEPSGPSWQDRSTPSSQQEILTQASLAADFNKGLSQQRSHREKYLDDYWKRPHEQPATEAPADGNNVVTTMSQHMQSPQASIDQARTQQTQLSSAGNPMMQQQYQGYPNQQNPMQSPVQNIHRTMPPTQLHQGSPSMSMPGQAQRTPSYGYGQQTPMWPPPQPQPSPLSHGHAMSQYGQHQSPMPPPQMQQQQQQQQQQPPGMGFGGMAGMNNPAYGNMARSIYQPSPSPSQFNMQQHQGGGAGPGGGQPHGMMGWNPPSSAGGMPQDWQRYQ